MLTRRCIKEEYLIYSSWETNDHEGHQERTIAIQIECDACCGQHDHAWSLYQNLGTTQQIGMLLVILGLMAKSKSSFDVITKSGGSDVLAIVLMLAGTILHSLTNVFNQKILQVCS